jgi:mannosyl-glycoprotein endo-beta-N-acetylglucosaminidase
MHLRLPGSQVIWYDSVVSDGSLRWQDQLNQRNQCFFNVSDGFFVNYTWDEERLKQSAINAGQKKHLIFTGIDVWGRNTFGGGGYNIHKVCFCNSGKIN